jgi:hypothetical protein
MIPRLRMAAINEALSPDLVLAGLAVGGHEQFGDGTGLVGPLVIPGVTSCLGNH